MQLPTKFLVPTEITKFELAKYAKNADEVFPFSFGLDYKQSWTVWMGLREFVQNAFDISTDPKSRKNLDAVDLKYDTKRKIGYITDQGDGIKFRDMFLRENKGKDRWERRCLRGRFGEGMKYALIPLLREGHQVMVRTVGADYHFTAAPVGREDEAFNLIHMIQTPNSNKKGTCIAISEVDPNDYKYRFVPLIERDAPEEILVKATQDCVARHAIRGRIDGKGALYVRDIYVSPINSYYSYNFWFNNTKKILDPNRNHLKVEEDYKHLVGLEFFALLEKINTPDGREFWKTLFTEMYRKGRVAARSKRQNPGKRARQKLIKQLKQELGQASSRLVPKNSFEWKYLDEFEYETLPYEKAEILFEVISEVVGTSNFSWSEDYSGGKTLEHFNVLDLRDKLPNLFGQIYHFIKSPQQLKELNELQDKIVVLPPSSFDILGKKIANKIALLHENLTEMAESMLNIHDEFAEDSPAERSLNGVYFYTGSFSEGAEGVAGFYSRAEHAIYVHAKYFKDPKFFVKVFIHEMAHANCDDNCSDITEEFENSMEEMAFGYQYNDYLAKKIWKSLGEIYWGLDGKIEEKFDWLLEQSNEGIKRESEKKREYANEGKRKRQGKKVSWKVRRAQARKRAKIKQEIAVLQLLRRADIIYTQGLDHTLPSVEGARTILQDGLKKSLRRPRLQGGGRTKVDKARLQKWQDDSYLHRFDENRAITALRKGTPKDWQYLRDKKAWKIWRMWQRRRRFNPRQSNPRIDSWKTDELALLKKNYLNYSLKELQRAFFPNRSVPAIRKRANEIGLRRKGWEALSTKNEEVIEGVCMECGRSEDEVTMLTSTLCRRCHRRLSRHRTLGKRCKTCKKTDVMFKESADICLKCKMKAKYRSIEGRRCISCWLTDKEKIEGGQIFGHYRDKCAACLARGKRNEWCPQKIHALPPSRERIAQTKGRTTRDYPACRCNKNTKDPMPRIIPLNDEDDPSRHYYAVKTRRKLNRQRAIHEADERSNIPGHGPSITFDATGRKGSSGKSPRRSTRGGAPYDVGPRKPSRRNPFSSSR